MKWNIFNKLNIYQPKFEFINKKLYLSFWKIKIRVPLEKKVFLVEIRSDSLTKKIDIRYNSVKPKKESWTEDGYVYTAIDSAHIDDLNDNLSKKIVDCLNTRSINIPLWIITLPLCLFGYGFIIIALIISLLIYELYDRYRKYTFIFYTIYDDYNTIKIAKLFDDLKELNKSCALFHLIADAPLKKDEINNPFLIENPHGFISNDIRIIDKIPPHIITNVKTPMINFGNQDFYFFPDRLFIFDNVVKRYASISYKNLSIKIKKTQFSLRDKIEDAVELDKAWKYRNKDGSKDNRYSKSNYMMYLYEIFLLKFTSKTGIYEKLYSSNKKYSKKFIRSFYELTKVSKK